MTHFQGRIVGCNLVLIVCAMLCVPVLALAEQGVTDTTILIGQTVGLTGIAADPVREMNEGANAYLSAINERGGVYGRKIELVTVDDQFDPARSAVNAERLIKKEGVFSLFLGRGTPHTKAILPILEANKVPLLAPGTGASIFHTPSNHWIFNVRARVQTEVAKGVEYLHTVGNDSIGILYVDSPAGEDGLEGFKQAMQSSKLSPAFIAKFPLVKPDCATTAAAIIQSGSKAVIIVSSSQNTIDVIKAIRRLGSKITILTLSNNSSNEFARDLGPDGTGIIVTQVTPPPHLMTSRLGQEFKVAAQRTGATVSYAAMEGFLNAKVLVEGLRRAGRNLTREGFINALETINKVDFGGITVTYGKNNHSGSDFVELTMIGKNGHFIR